MGTGQSISSNVYTKIAFNLEDFDVGGCYNTANFRFTPNVAGIYCISSSVGIITPGAVCSTLTAITFNGTTTRENWSTVANISNTYTNHASALLRFNGSSDYVEIYGYQNSGVTCTAASGVYSWFEAFFVRPTP